MIIDAEDQVLGRLATTIAKKVLEGENIIVINAEKAVITGTSDTIMNDFFARVKRGDPHHGPYYPRIPNLIFKRSVRGMLPYKKSKGREALKRLKVINGNPENLKGEKMVKNVSQLNCKFLTLDQVSKRLRGLA